MPILPRTAPTGRGRRSDGRVPAAGRTREARVCGVGIGGSRRTGMASRASVTITTHRACPRASCRQRLINAAGR